MFCPTRSYWTSSHYTPVFTSPFSLYFRPAVPFLLHRYIKHAAASGPVHCMFSLLEEWDHFAFSCHRLKPTSATTSTWQILHYHRPDTTKSSKHRPNTLKPWTKVTPCSLHTLSLENGKLVGTDLCQISEWDWPSWLHVLGQISEPSCASISPLIKCDNSAHYLGWCENGRSKKVMSP